MTLLNSADLDLLRTPKQKSNFYLTWLKHTVIATAQVGGSPSSGDTSVVLTAKATVERTEDFIDVGQEVWFGSSAGNNDIGIGRIKAINWAGDSLTIAFNSFNSKFVW